MNATLLPPQISIVIPAFNEAQRLPATLAAIAAYCHTRPERFEVLIVDDGSADATPRLPLPPSTPQLTWRILAPVGHRGKGFCVRRGMTEACGALRLFTDADLSAPIAELEHLEAAVAAGADIAIGSRRGKIAVRQPPLRKAAGRLFNRLVRFALGLPFADTQCGFKLFTRAAAEAVFPRQRIDGWGFDPELLYLARRARLRVAEVPVAWSHAEGAKIHLLRDSARMFADVFVIRTAAWRSLYAPGAAPPKSPSALRAR